MDANATMYFSSFFNTFFLGGSIWPDISGQDYVSICLPP